MPRPKVTKEYLESLPCRYINAAGKPTLVKYDAENNLIHLLDANGVYTGHSGSAEAVVFSDNASPKEKPVPSPKQEEKEPKASEEPGESNASEEAREPNNLAPMEKAPAETDEPEEESSEDEEDGSLKSLLYRYRFPVLIAAGALAALLIIWFVLNTFGDGSGVPIETTASTVQTTASAETTAPVETTASLETTEPATEAPTEETAPPILALTARKSLLPGNEIKADILALTEISAAEQAMLRSVGGVYMSEDQPLVEGMIATAYIPEGSFLWYTDIGSTYAPVNPWAAVPEGYSTVVLPVQIQTAELGNILWGNQADIKVVTETKLTTDYEPAQPDADGDTGLQHDSSTVESMVIDTYILPNALIVDAQSKAGGSLFPTYTSLSSIPAAFRAKHIQSVCGSTEALADCYIPYYIVICVPTAQAEIINGLEQSSMTISVVAVRAAAETSLEESAYQASQEVAASIDRAWTELERSVVSE